MNENKRLRDTLRHDFAKRCFLDIADHDYIAARTLIRNGCYDQAFILMQQCIEKYLKAILLYNKIPSNNPITKPNHDLEKLLEMSQQKVDYFKVSDDIIQFIQLLNGIEHSRYLTYSHYAFYQWFISLDKCVWELRFFAQPEFCKQLINETISKGLDNYIGSNLINGGELEKILSLRNYNRDKTLRKNLVWKNIYYPGRRKKYILKKVTFGTLSKVSPFDIGDKHRQEILYDAIKDLVYIPKNLRIELEKLK